MKQIVHLIQQDLCIPKYAEDFSTSDLTELVDMTEDNIIMYTKASYKDMFKKIEKNKELRNNSQSSKNKKRKQEENEENVVVNQGESSKPSSGIIKTTDFDKMRIDNLLN
ncbi:885_t:CDS:2 [Funneliformis caledonium]|uniref:885_t:CDS:1 n=1 Tax=Funneliformis caledonium TaxID=1117310 RepID=A0A9N9EYJ6_9GLOM|nr:885_t:CDS:2 [Funneliformis caledonium]